MQLRAVFLDVGGTLLAEDTPRPAIYARAARKRGIDVCDERMLELMREVHRELPIEIDGAYRYSDSWFAAFIERIFVDRLGLDPRRRADVIAELFAAFEDAATFRMFPGTVGLLAELRERGIVVGIVSNWSARLPKLLDVLELAPRLDFVVCSAIDRVEKPDPAIFRLALERSGAAPGEALHAGDHLKKDAAALDAGVAFVLVDHAGAHPTCPYERVTDLPSLGRAVLARLP